MGSDYYEIKVKGNLDEHRAEWFGYMQVSHGESNCSTLSGFVLDQAALHGIQAKVRDLSLPLNSMRRREQVANKPK